MSHSEYRPIVGPIELRPDRCRRGKITPAVRRWCFERDNHTCVDCGTQADLSLDHIVPACVGGTEWASNLAARCRRCNSLRHAAYVREHGPVGYPPPPYFTEHGVVA